MLHFSLWTCPKKQNKCPEPESNQRHKDFQSFALPTELSGQKEIAGAGFEPTTFGLWARRASRLLHPATLFNLLYTYLGKICNLLEDFLLPNGWRWIRTTESVANRFTVCPLWPLGNPSKKSFAKLDYVSLRATTWLQLSSNFDYVSFSLSSLPKPMIGLEPITCWLQISCSANWATSAQWTFIH